MTEKRFIKKQERVHYIDDGENIFEWVIYDTSDNNKVIVYTDMEREANICCNLLNELHEENQYLKSLKWNQDCINEISIGIQQRQLLEEENEQLNENNLHLHHELRLKNDKVLELEKENKQLKKENKELNSIKHFADTHGINIFNIDEAFRRCWNDNEKLVIKNKELQERNNRQCKQLDDLCRLIEEKDWRALSDIMDDFKRNDEQLQKEWKCYDE